MVLTRCNYNRCIEELHPTSIRLSPELKAQLKQFAQEDRRSLSSYVVLALERHVAERDKRKKPVERR